MRLIILSAVACLSLALPALASAARFFLARNCRF